MDMHPVPSLQFQASLKVASCVVCHPFVLKPSIYDRFERIRHLFIKAIALSLVDREQNWAEILTDLSLPDVLEKEVSVHIYSVLRQLYSFMADAKNIFHCDLCPNSPLREVEDIVKYICWTSEGFIDMNRTIEKLKLIVLETCTDETVSRDFTTLCSYFLDYNIFSVWREWKEPYVVKKSDCFQLYLTHSKTFREELCFQFTTFSRYSFDIQFMEMFREKQALVERNRFVNNILKTAVDHSTYVANLNHARALRFFLMQYDSTERNERIQNCMDDEGTWVILLLKFRYFPDKTIYWKLLEQTLKTLQSTAFIQFLKKLGWYFFIAFNENLSRFKLDKLRSTILFKLFRDLWNCSPTIYREEFLNSESGLKSLLECGYFSTVDTVVMLFKNLKSYDENQQFLNRHRQLVFESVFSFKMYYIQEISQDFASFQIMIKEMAKEYLWQEVHYPFIVHRGFKFGIQKCISLSQLSSEEEEEVKRKFYVYFIQNRLGDYKSILSLDFVRWCVVDEAELDSVQKRLGMEVSRETVERHPRRTLRNDERILHSNANVSLDTRKKDDDYVSHMQFFMFPYVKFFSNFHTVLYDAMYG